MNHPLPPSAPPMRNPTAPPEAPLTLEQRVEALERAFARIIRDGAANELRKHDAAHVAPGALAETLAKPARDEKTIPPIAEMSREHQIALMEGYLAAASEEFFTARNHLCYPINQRIYEAAYKRGWQDRGDQQ